MNSEQKVALVTGANKGIGKEIARGLAQRGMIVLIGARSELRGAQSAQDLTGDGDVRYLPLDVTDSESIRLAVEAIEKAFGRLDVLVNNAGIAVGERVPPSKTTVEQFRQIYETNVFGVVAVTNAMLPFLRQSSAGRIVNISSARGSFGSPRALEGQPLMPYSTSKTALNAITLHYAKELADTPIKINAASPGHVATDFNNHAGTRTATEGAAIALHLATLDVDGPSGGFFNDDGVVPW